ERCGLTSSLATGRRDRCCEFTAGAGDQTKLVTRPVKALPEPSQTHRIRRYLATFNGETLLGTLVLPLLMNSQRVAMSDLNPTQGLLCWCQVPVPQELNDERLCVLHFILSIDHDCADLRRETAMGTTSPERQCEIAAYVKATAMKLTEVATSRS